MSRKTTILDNLIEKHGVSLEEAEIMYLAKQRESGRAGGKASTGYGFAHGAVDQREAGRKGGLARNKNKEKL